MKTEIKVLIEFFSNNKKIHELESKSTHKILLPCILDYIRAQGVAAPAKIFSKEKIDQLFKTDLILFTFTEIRQDSIKRIVNSKKLAAPIKAVYLDTKQGNNYLIFEYSCQTQYPNHYYYFIDELKPNRRC